MGGVVGVMFILFKGYYVIIIKDFMFVVNFIFGYEVYV